MMDDPPIHVHWPPLYFHRSFKSPDAPVESIPYPPKSHRFPDASVQDKGEVRAPGVLSGLAAPIVP